MTDHDVTLSLPDDLVRTLHRIARDRAETVEDLLREMLDGDIAQFRSGAPMADEGETRVTRLRHLLAPDIQRARGWDELQARLALYGVALRDDAGGMALHDLITRERLCSSAALGFDGRTLAARFGGALPPVASAVAARTSTASGFAGAA